jgi:dUTP pyrophosphatase
MGQDNFDIKRGDRIAQLVPAPVQRAIFAEVADLPHTERGAGGFGSTGTDSEEGDVADPKGVGSLSGIKLRRPGE